MKTTIDIADELFLRARQVAAERGCTFRSLVEAGLREVLDAEHKAGLAPAFRMTTYGTGGLTEAYRDRGLLEALYDSYPSSAGAASVQGVQDTDDTP